MTQINFKSAGVSARTIDLTGPTDIQPVGIPAGVIGTAKKGPAFVPITFATRQDFTVVFGEPTDDAFNGPLAVGEWLKSQQAATYVRVLGSGQGKKREISGDNQGRVRGAGFVVGDQQPQGGGGLNDNSKAVVGGAGEGRLYFLTTFMSESNSSGMFTNAGLKGEAQPIVRGVLMAASGVIPTLSSSLADSTPPVANSPAGTSDKGAPVGSVNLSGGRQEFVLLLNGHKGSDSSYPNVVTASFDINAPNYLGAALNSDPLKLEDAGYVLYADYAIHPGLAAVTGSGIVTPESGSNADGTGGREPIAFLASGSIGRNTGSTDAPSYENFEDRYRNALSTFVVSQRFGGKPENLFKIHALDDGVTPNTGIKWSIENITPSNSDVSPYGTFDLLVRVYNDIDKKREVLEAWRGLSLNPSSENYIARAIGDQHKFFNFDASVDSQKLETQGVYPNKSKYIRVEVTDKVENAEIDPGALPMGFRGPAHLVTSGSAPLADLSEFSDGQLFTTNSVNPVYDTVQMPVPYRENINRGTGGNVRADKGLYWGVQFEQKVSASAPNSSTARETSIKGFTKYFPRFHTDFQNVVVQDNAGAADTTENGVIDADRFNNNLFSLEHVKITFDTTDSDESADVTQLVSWSYQRSGPPSKDVSAATRGLTVSDLSDASVRQLAKFNGIVHGGFDGVRIFNEDTKNLTNKAIVEEMDNANRGTSNGATVTAYNKALDIMADDTEVDVKLLASPGIRHSVITDEAIRITQDRFDAMYIMDVPEYDTTNKLVTSSLQNTSVRFTANNHSARGLNNSFGAAYFPNVIMRDDLNGTTREVPPSVPVLGAFALNDAVGFPWFAPAGFTRGALESVQEATIPLNRANMNSLQSVNINPLVSFAGSDGLVVWGQKTLLARDSALERVNVRRLLINLRRQVRRISRRIIFEQNRAETLARFSQLVNPILKRVQDQKGLERFLVKIDTETTTQADIENKTIRGKIFLVPTKTLEFLSIDFVVTNQDNFVTSV